MLHLLPLAVMAALSVVITGCTLTVAPLAKHTAAFSTATSTVVDGSEGAYRAANELRRREQIAEAIDNYGNPGWSPYTPLKPLLSQEQIVARIKVLEALKAYAEALATLTDSKRAYKKIDDSATAAGGSLQSLIGADAPDLKTVFPGIKGLSADEANGISVAINGVGRLLVNGRIKKSLASTTREMEPDIQSLCGVIESDVKILRDLADVDYKTAIQNEDQFIQHNQIDPAVRRIEIGKMITLVDQRKANDALLEKLSNAVAELAKAHTALRDAAAGKDPESLKQRIVELTGLGQDLASYYKSLSASASS